MVRIIYILVFSIFAASLNLHAADFQYSLNPLATESSGWALLLLVLGLGLYQLIRSNKKGNKPFLGANKQRYPKAPNSEIINEASK